MALMTEPWTQDPLVREDADLRALLDQLATTAREPVDPAVRARTIEAVLLEAAQRTRPEATPPWTTRVRRVLAMTGVKVLLAGGVATAATTGGLAATGSLPAPVQDAAHDLGERIGIGIPAAPGQVKKVDGDPDSTGRDHAPGQTIAPDAPDTAPGRQPSDGEPGSTGRDDAPGRTIAPDAPGTAPGQDVRDGVEPGPPEPAPGPTDRDEPPPGQDVREDTPDGRAADEGPASSSGSPAPPEDQDPESTTGGQDAGRSGPATPPVGRGQAKKAG
jgi:hypothetical protein